MDSQKGNWFNDGRIFPSQKQAIELGEDLKFERGYDYQLVKTENGYHIKVYILERQLTKYN